MNPAARFYAITLGLATTVLFTTPADAANLGLFEVDGHGTSREGNESFLRGTFDLQLDTFNIVSTTLFPNNRYVSRDYNDTTGLATFFSGGTLNIYNGKSGRGITASLKFGDDMDVKSLLEGLNTGETVKIPGYENVGNGSSASTTYGDVRFTSIDNHSAEPVPEPSDILGVVSAGALLLGGVFVKRRKLVKS